MSFGPPAGSPFAGASATSTSAAAGLPFAGMPSELAARAETILAEEPEHPPSNVAFSHHDWDREPFTLRRFLRPQRRGLVWAVLLVVVETLAFQSGPLLVQIGIDEAIVPRRAPILLVVAGLYIAAIVVNGVTSRIRIAHTGRMGESLMYRLRVKVFAHLQRQSLDFFTANKAGVVMTRMTSDIDNLAALFQDGLVNLVVQGLTLVVITGVVVSLNPTLAAITLLVIVPSMLGLTWWFKGASERGYGLVRDKIALVLADLSESLAAVRVVSAHNRRRHNVIHHTNVVGQHRAANVQAAKVGVIYGPATEGVGVLGQAAILAIGGQMVLDGTLTVGELFAFLLYLTALFAPIQQLVQLYNAYQSGQSSVVKLRQLLAQAPTVVESPQATDLECVAGAISFNNVDFSYVDGEPVLHNINLEIQPGQTVAVVGPTGAGKSTVAKLITRFHDPSAGTVCIDGHDLRSLTIASLRSHLGVVPQEPFLFNRSIGENVAFARTDLVTALRGDPGAARSAAEDEIRHACRAVGIDELVERLGGLGAVVHERGASLSSGERQLMALARAMVANPSILVLDEATSNLDLVLESRIEAALDAVSQGRTTIVIAHRLATAMRADTIIVIEDGVVQQAGTPQQLLADGGQYAEMYAAWIAQH